MRLIPALMAVLATATAANVATAIPTAYYNPANGSIFLQNDTGSSLAVVNFKSPSGLLGGQSLSIPGTSQDTGDKPHYLVYFSVPPTASDPAWWHNIGPVVKGTHPGHRFDITFTYFVSFAPGQQEQQGVIYCPEPTAMALTACGAMGFVSLHRRQRRQSH